MDNNYELGKACFFNKEYDKAATYFVSGMEEGILACVLALGYTFSFRDDGKKNYNLAFNCYKTAENYNSEISLCNLGYCFEKAQGCQKDLKKAFKYYEKAAASNLPRALNNLGFMYLYGLGCSKDTIKAENILKESAEYGNTMAMANLATLYKTKGKTDLFIEYATKAAEARDPTAIKMLKDAGVDTSSYKELLLDFSEILFSELDEIVE